MYTDVRVCTTQPRKPHPDQDIGYFHRPQKIPTCPFSVNYPIRPEHLGGSVKHPALGFSSGHDLMVHGIELSGSTLRRACLRFSLPLRLSLPGSLMLACSLALSQNK